MFNHHKLKILEIIFCAIVLASASIKINTVPFVFVLLMFLKMGTQFISVCSIEIASITPWYRYTLVYLKDNSMFQLVYQFHLVILQNIERLLTFFFLVSDFFPFLLRRWILRIQCNLQIGDDLCRINRYLLFHLDHCNLLLFDNLLFSLLLHLR
jgi:hypothetical protein